MQKRTINWLGWAALSVFSIFAVTGIKIEICHTGDRNLPIKMEHNIDSPSYGGLNVRHHSEPLGFHVNLDNRQKNY